jgi:hypothetical protein
MKSCGKIKPLYRLPESRQTRNEVATMIAVSLTNIALRNQIEHQDEKSINGNQAESKSQILCLLCYIYISPCGRTTLKSRGGMS